MQIIEPYDSFFEMCFSTEIKNININTDYTITELYKLIIVNNKGSLTLADSTLRNHFIDFLKRAEYVELKTDKRPYKVNIKEFEEELTYYLREVQPRKEKNILYLDNNLYYDFNTNEFNKKRINKLHATNNDYMFIYNYLNNYKDIKEWLFSYIDLLPHSAYDLSQIDFDCPKGYIDFLRARNRQIYKSSYNEFIYMNKYNVKNKYLLCFLMNSVTSAVREEIFNFISEKDIIKIVVNSAKNFEFTQDRRLSELLTLIVTYEFKNYDTNRGIKYNTDLIAKFIQDKENEILSNNLQKLNFLNGFNFLEDYVIVVPQNIEDLQNESKQQNNCVGYYYNSQIIRGTQLIYFIRKKDNIEKSYITCRFSVRENATREARAKNNADIAQHMKNSITNEIDKVIKKNLKAKKDLL